MPTSRYLIGNLPWYGALIVFGAALAIWLAAREEKHVNLPKDTILDLALRLLPIGILGARVYYVLFSWDTYRANPISVLYIWEGGLAIYGGIIAGFLVIWVFCRRRKISLWLLCDLVAPGVALAQGIGRWGNFFNMEAYGIPLDHPALCFFPLAVQIPEGDALVWHLATFFLESAWDILIFVFLLFARRKLLRREGDVFRFYAFLYAAGRLVIEEYRMDSLYSSDIRVSQLLSLLVMLIIIGYYWVTLRSRPAALPILRSCAAALVLICGVFVGCYALHLSFFPQLTIPEKTIFLLSFSGLSLCALFLIYGVSAPEEIRYAHH